MYAFLLPFLILGTASEAVRVWKDGTAPWPRVCSTAAAVLRSRYMALGVFALLFGATVLGFNFANEYAAFGGETAVTELPSVQSMLRRTGLSQDASFDPGWWLHFLRQQFFRVCVASVPFVLTDWGADLRESFPSVHFSRPDLSGLELSVSLLLLLMVVVASTTVVWLSRPLLARRCRMLLATLALSGFFWSLPMRHNTEQHNFEALYYVGVPLVFYSLLLLYIHKRWGSGSVLGLAVAALLAFVVSAFQMDRRWRPDARAAEIQQAAMTELGSIRETAEGKVLLLLPSVKPEWSRQVKEEWYEWRYYLAGSVLTQSLDVGAAARAADFLVTRDRVESDALLTPGNERVFLYDSAGIDDLVGLYRATYQRVVSGEPAARSHFDVYLRDGGLFHVKDPCVEDVGYRVFVEVVQEDPKVLPGRIGRDGSRGYKFSFQLSGVLFEGKCMAVLSLPDYPISGIRTGQRPYRVLRREGARGWEVEIPASR